MAFLDHPYRFISTIMDHHGTSWIIMDNHGSSWIIIEGVNECLNECLNESMTAFNEGLSESQDLFNGRS